MEGKRDRAPELLAELVRLKVDISVVSAGLGTIQAAKKATKTIPIIMAGEGIDPVKAGIVESLAHPGGNVTGFTSLQGELGVKRLELLKEAVPKLARVALLYDSASAGDCTRAQRVSPCLGARAGIDSSALGVRSADDFDRVFAAIDKQRPDGLYVLVGPLTRDYGNRIAGFALKSRLPSTYVYREDVDAGGLMYYGADLAESYRRVAAYVDKILKGAKPGRSSRGTTDEVRAGYQRENGEADWRDGSSVDAVSGGQGD
jgi:putative ABC transport system substrate-binding protein